MSEASTRDCRVYSSIAWLLNHFRMTNGPAVNCRLRPWLHSAARVFCRSSLNIRLGRVADFLLLEKSSSTTQRPNRVCGKHAALVVRATLLSILRREFSSTFIMTTQLFVRGPLERVGGVAGGERWRPYPTAVAVYSLRWAALRYALFLMLFFFILP